ncbi:MAG: hypothetical protein LBL36_00035, partial [Clostridiales Family XIII bacterium]|nr:hypothetical protein [Clostridiales Family XIII bacterium]
FFIIKILTTSLPPYISRQPHAPTGFKTAFPHSDPPLDVRFKHAPLDRSAARRYHCIIVLFN